MEIEDINIYRYEVISIINGNKCTILVTDNKQIAIYCYNCKRNKYINNKNHVILFIYDYDKNANIEYFDNEIDI